MGTMKTNIVNEDQPMTLFGSKTPKTVIYKSESHKLHLAFNVKKGETIVQGMPVALTEDGQIEPYVKDSSSKVYLGIALTDNVNPAYQAQRDFPVEVTVMVEGYAVCNWVSNGEITCGYVEPSGDLLNERFVKANQGIESNFIAITPAEEANELIQVIIR